MMKILWPFDPSKGPTRSALNCEDSHATWIEVNSTDGRPILCEYFSQESQD